jgi:thymidylate synthase
MVSGDRRDSRNGDTFSLFKNDMKFDLRNGFPLITTKRMFFRGIVEEFLFFIRGETDSSKLSQKKITIWEKNTSKDFIASMGLPYATGVMGPMYGYQWRFFNSPYLFDAFGKPLKKVEGGIDQLANVINLINTDPTSRRILLTSYNPSQANLGVLYPCHSIIIQFYVEDAYLDMFCYNRSQDSFLGVPFNIASSSLLLMVIAKITNKIPRFLYITMGDTHIYSSHTQEVEKILTRMPYAFPIVTIPEIKTLEQLTELTSNDFVLSNYNYHPSIKVEMVA